MEEIIFRHGGTSHKFPGDGAMASFGIPDTRQDDRECALRCVRDMVGINLPHRLAVSVGALFACVEGADMPDLFECVGPMDLRGRDKAINVWRIV